MSLHIIHSRNAYFCCRTNCTVGLMVLLTYGSCSRANMVYLVRFHMAMAPSIRWQLPASTLLQVLKFTTRTFLNLVCYYHFKLYILYFDYYYVSYSC